MKRSKTSYTIKTVAQALDLMEQFQDDTAELGGAELKKRLEVPSHRISRLLRTLESRSYLERNPATDGYRLGLGAYCFAAISNRHGGKRT